MSKNIILFLALVFSFLMVGVAQTKTNSLPSGKWIVISEQISYLKDKKVIKEFPTEEVTPEEAYVYDFVNAKNVVVTNSNNDFAWKFKLKVNKNNLELENINGDAEDDEFSYQFINDKLVFKRVMQDSDPDGEDYVIDVVFTITLRKI